MHPDHVHPKQLGIPRKEAGKGGISCTFLLLLSSRAQDMQGVARPEMSTACQQAQFCDIDSNKQAGKLNFIATVL